MSAFSWLDYSEFERQQAMQVIDLFREEDTRDELGLGTIRDALADLFFPGTSTIQTRARYFLFVPWVALELEDKRIPSRDAAYRFRMLQGKLRDGLIEGGEESGVIGYRAGLHVKRLPTSVYWNGLREWGILKFSASEQDYCRYLDAFYRRLDGLVKEDAGDSPDAVPVNWDASLPRPPSSFPLDVSFELTRTEADYLIDRIVARARGSLLAHLLLGTYRVEEEQQFPWETPALAVLPEELRIQIAHARSFSQAMYGAALLYNLILAEQKPGGALIEVYRDRLANWYTGLRAAGPNLRSWDRHQFWQFIDGLDARVTVPTRQFVDSWTSLVHDSASLASLVDGETARNGIREREICLKRGRARIGNQRAVENWQGASGTAQLDYRWNRPVRALVNDLLGPLAEKGELHA